MLTDSTPFKPLGGTEKEKSASGVRLSVKNDYKLNEEKVKFKEATQ